MKGLLREKRRRGREYLRDLPVVGATWSGVRGRMQALSAARERRRYEALARRRGVELVEGEALREALRQRLDDRGVAPRTRAKGELHIFLVYYAITWEKILPVVLGRFGWVTEFVFDADRLTECAPAIWSGRCREMNQQMLDAFRAANRRQPVDVVVSYASGATVSPEAMRELGRGGAVVINFCWDDKLDFMGKSENGHRRGVGALASAVDLNLTSSVDSRIKYQVEGGLASFWPEGADPELHRPYERAFEYDVSFVGARYGKRAGFIERLRRSGIDVAAFGKGWARGSLSDEEMVEMYSRSRINLGFSGIGCSRRLCHLKGRDFEVPMSGGLYLTQDHPELSLVYEVGEEIVTYRDESDCADRIRGLLANPMKAERIRQAGRARALRDHTWDRRFEEAFKLVGVLEERTPAGRALAGTLF